MRTLRDVLYNFHWVVPGEAARAAQAWAGSLGPFLTRNGIRAMINLRGPNPKYGWWRSEKSVTQARGIAHIDTTLDSRHLPTRAMLVALLDAFDAAPKPFLVKCSAGRTAPAWPRRSISCTARAGRRCPRHGRNSPAGPICISPKPSSAGCAISSNSPGKTPRGLPIADWIRSAYTPERLRDWLTAHGRGDTFKAIFEKPAPANRRQW
ncbi:MAG: hypothetical protein WDM81_12150 [Rhizomicrobium sp.]